MSANYNYTKISSAASTTSVRDRFNTFSAKRKAIPMGETKAVVLSVEFPAEPDMFGDYFVIVLKNGNGSKTARCGSIGAEMRDIVKIHAGQAVISKKGYALDDGWAWETFFNRIKEQLPECAGMEEMADIVDYLETCHPDITVWYTRSDKGYINAYFSEYDYKVYGLHQEVSDDGIVEDSEEENGEEVAEQLF